MVLLAHVKDSRESAKVVVKNRSAIEFPIVGMGASAGGLEVFKKFFRAMPSESGMAFILILHLKPGQENSTAKILARHTAMKVVQIEDVMSVESNHVYIIPPDKDLIIQNGVLHLIEPAQHHGMRRLPIDFFFRSLAEDQQRKALCVILSGTGTDGTLGLKAIKGHGGMVMAQSPETVQFNAISRSAIATGMIDYMLPVEAMPDALIQYVQSARGLMGTTSTSETAAPDQLDSVLAALRLHTQYDFYGYKKSTLMRRIERRMRLNHLSEIGDYARTVEENQQEAARLFNDLLIGVTSFYRDPEAYKLLDKEVIQKVVREKGMLEPIRAWVPGCATGEEAYSICILFLEQVQAMQKHCPIQIFASDINGQALAEARAGVCPVNIVADVSSERLRQFFSQRDESYQVGQQLRNAVVFTVQNLISDPPFSNLDLICCRNLLIYLEPEVQRKIIAMFHSGLNEGGFLFLGNSETIGRLEELFHPISKKFRLYRRIGLSPRRDKLDLSCVSGLEANDRSRTGVQAGRAGPANLGRITQQLLLEYYAPFAVLINLKYEVLYLYGQSGPYLELTTGKSTQDLRFMVREGLRSKLRGAVQKVIQGEPEIMIEAQVKRDGVYYPVRLRVLLVKASAEVEGLMVVTFAEATESAQMKIESDIKTEMASEALVSQLELELSEAKAELRCSAEELEASNEEFQSLNEELTTVNDQLQDKIEELATSNSDLANLLSNTNVAVLFLDAQFRIKRFTSPVCKLFNLILSDVGRPIVDISHRIKNLDLVRDAETVLMHLTPVEKNVHTDEGECFILRVLPFRTEDNRIDGVVATFVDVSSLKQTEKSLARSKECIELLLKSTGEAIFGVDKEGRCIFVNDKFSKQLGFTADEMLGNKVHEFIHHTHSDGSTYPWEECSVYRCLKEGVSYQDDHELSWRKDGTSFPTSYTVEPVVENGIVTGAVVLFRDMTEAYALSNKLTHLARHDALTGLVNRRGFEERLEQVLERTQHSHARHALCYLDLDQFKVINDTCGHLAGDQLLRQIAGVLSQSVRKRDLIARLGGDEFGLLMENCDIEGAELSAKNIRDAVAGYRFQWEGKTHVIGVSIGIVSITQDAGSLIDVLKAADSACYVAKEGGRNRFHVFHEGDTVLAARHGEMEWVVRINRALEENRLLLALQPIAPIHGAKEESVSYEVLLRMQEEDGRIFLPTDFLGAAERYNLAIKVDRWVFSRFFKWHAGNKSKLKHVPLFNINVSGQSLGDEDFMNFALAELKKYQIPPAKICFEITETAAITNLTSANRFIHAVKKLGCLFALDDFGTGLSSFGYLKTLPVDFLKISGLFVKDITDNSIDLAMVKSINDIGQVMGKKTIAESVESEEILAKLSGLGVDYAQGYFIGKPVLLDDLTFARKQDI